MAISRDLLGIICVVCSLSTTSEAYHAVIKDTKPRQVCPCEYKYAPVCGSDGVTYMNECVLTCSSFINEAEGSEPVTKVLDCECGVCNCQNVDLPVCTLDGQTYPNECELACENIQRIKNKLYILNLAYRTACLGPPGFCTDIAAPVCGTDNVLYRNRCVLDYASRGKDERGLEPIQVKNVGACQDGCLCPLNKEPVCGTDGNYYNNICELTCKSEHAKRDNGSLVFEANERVCEGCYCTADYEPVCASDGKTYSNPCRLNCEIERQQNPSLKAVHSGRCPCDCDNTCAPICGSDRKTYLNPCWFECEKDERKNLPPLEVLHEGECKDVDCDCSHCGDTLQQQCGSDGQTYLNLCWLNCRNTCNQKNGKPGVFLAKRGEC